MKGVISVGYQLINNNFFGKTLKQGGRIGDYDCVKQRVSEFMYKAVVPTEAFVMKRIDFLNIIKTSLGKNLITVIE